MLDHYCYDDDVGPTQGYQIVKIVSLHFTSAVNICTCLFTVGEAINLCEKSLIQVDESMKFTSI